MPLVRISVSNAMAPERRRELPGVVYEAMRETIAIPDGDLFVTVSAHSEGEFVFDPKFMGMQRTADFVLVHITLRRGRTTEAKQRLYREIARLAGERAGLASDDIMVVMAENGTDDWSFGKGEAQYVSQPPAQGVQG